MQHYFLNKNIKVGDKTELPNDVSKHWLRVMRAKNGDEAEFVSDTSKVYIGKLINSDNAEIEIVEALAKNVEMPINVTIACGLPKNGKAEFIVQKATEMGVKSIIFLPSDWSIAKWNNKADKKIKRLQKIAKSAAEQSHRNVIPQIVYLNKLSKLKNVTSDQKIVAYEESAKQGETSRLQQVISLMNAGQKLLAFFGPEGGISPAEIEKLRGMDFTLVGLGPRILRTESAPLYLLSAISTITELQQKK